MGWVLFELPNGELAFKKEKFKWRNLWFRPNINLTTDYEAVRSQKIDKRRANASSKSKLAHKDVD